ncbi:Protein kinase domain-containing protein ppk32, partial [Coemansia sp. RSA 1933]
MEGYLNKLRGLASSAVNAIQSRIGRDYSVDLNAPAAGRSGLWALHQATRRSGSSNSGASQVTVWVFEKRYFEQGINRQLISEREQTLLLERLRAEAGQLARLRHPSVVQVVEPLEETRAWLMFVTERVMASLDDLVTQRDGVRRVTDGDEDFELDDLEIQKGLLQVAKALGFLHTDAHLVHGNLVPASVLVNAAGDWKLGGFGFSHSTTGAADSERFEHDYQMPEHTQQDLDYLAPELVLHGTWTPALDVFAFGCLVTAVYSGDGMSPLACRNDVGAYRREIARLPDAELQVPDALIPAVRGLLRADPSSRITLRDFQSSKHFDDVRVATLWFLETLVEQPDDQKNRFLRSLPRVLPRFPDRVLRCKILVLLYTHATDRQLLPAIMPCVLFIVGRLQSEREFETRAMPGFVPLLAAARESSPEAVCVVLDHLGVLQTRAPSRVFRGDVMDLVYDALVSANARVQERALTAVPSIAKSLDPGDVREKLLPRVQHAYARAAVLAHKVRALACVRGMLSALDRAAIVGTVLPMLSRTKTREPAVVMAMLAVYEDLGLNHLDKQAVAAEVLPVLWRQSIDGRLRSDQFTRFMGVIRALADRVEKEHLEYLERRRRVLGDKSDDLTADQLDNDVDETIEDSTDAFEAMVLGTASPAKSDNRTRPTAMANPLAGFDAPANPDAGWTWDADEQPAPSAVSVDIDGSDDFGSF